LESDSYVEIIVLLACQIDAFLRSSIILKQQLVGQSNDIEVKYLYQADDDRGITERKIYQKAFDLEIIDQNTFNELNELYNFRNRVIHRYIISHLKTRKVRDIAYDYAILNEKIRLVLENHEHMQIDKGIGIYGSGFSHGEDLDALDVKRAHAAVNDKHLIDKLNRKI
jgi:hypothetical protein